MFRSQHRKSDAELEQELWLQLGDGPMRFGPVRQMCSVAAEAELRGLGDEDIRRFAAIKVEWDNRKVAKSKKYTNEQLLRVAIFCGFSVGRSIRLLQRSDPMYFVLTTLDQEFITQLQTKTLFPCPGLKTKEGLNVFYMRPSRFDPSETSTEMIVANLVYVMNHMDYQDSESGLAFVANMTGWTKNHFSYAYARAFLTCLQGKKFPATVSLFLIVNPPPWFGKVWAIMKTMMSTNFAEKVHMITDDELPYYLQDSYEEFLPDEFDDGQVNTDELVRDYVCFRNTLEITSNTSYRHGRRLLAFGQSSRGSSRNKATRSRRSFFRPGRRRSMPTRTEKSLEDVEEDESTTMNISGHSGASYLRH